MPHALVPAFVIYVLFPRTLRHDLVNANPQYIAAKKIETNTIY